MQSDNQEFTVINESRNSTLARQVHIAGNSRTRRRGLLGIKSLHADAGLWIRPCEAIHTFGMKTHIDAVFIDRQLCVKKIKPALRAGRIALCLTAHSILELATGTIERSGTVVGDRLRITASANADSA